MSRDPSPASDNLERDLRRLRFRQPPADWRSLILDAGRRAADPPRAGGPALVPTWDQWLREWLWPHPIAWGTLAALWLGLLILGHAGRYEGMQPLGPPPAATLLRMTLLEQQRELGSLLGEESPTSPRPEAPQPPTPQTALPTFNPVC